MTKTRGRREYAKDWQKRNRAKLKRRGLREIRVVCYPEDIARIRLFAVEAREKSARNKPGGKPPITRGEYSGLYHGEQMTAPKMTSLQFRDAMERISSVLSDLSDETYAARLSMTRVEPDELLGMSERAAKAAQRLLDLYNDVYGEGEK